MEVLEFLELYLLATLNLSKDEVAELISDGKLKAEAKEKLLNLDKERVRNLTTEKVDEGYKKAQKEVLSKFESQLKEKYGISSNKVGLELVEEVVSAKSAKPGEIKDEDVKKHKLYLDLAENQQKAIDEAVKKKQLEFDNYRNEVEGSKVLEQVRNKALTVFKGLKPILSEDATKAENQTKLFLNQLLTAKKYRIDGERVIMLDDNGKDLTDAHGKRVDFETHLKELAGNHFDFQVSDPKGSGGAGGAGGSGGGGGAVKQPKSKDEFVKAMEGAKTAEERAAISKGWREFQQANPGAID